MNAGFLVVMLVALAAAGTPRDAHASQPSTRAPGTRAIAGPEAPQAGCCSGPGILNFGNRLDFSDQDEDTEITNQYRSLGVRFGRDASPLAANTVVRVDWSRDPGCRNVLNGDPEMAGWEFFIFANPGANQWARVQKVGASVGYCDQQNSCFIAVYDANGQLLESKFNDAVGFQFLSIERPSADICRVLVGDCGGGTAICSPDAAGSALNCLTFSTPVATALALPDTVRVPPPPFVPALPATSAPGLVTLAALLAGTAMLVFARKRRAESGASV